MGMKKPRKIKVFERDLSGEIINGDEVWGYWQDVGKMGEIHLDKSLRHKKHLTILIHELLHEAYPKKTEKEIIRVSTIIANILWRKGYRRRSG